MMAWNGVVSRLRRPESNETLDLSPSNSEDVHVLAVDDNLIDRIVIERLLKNTSCKVTAVESGTRALQYLGLDGEKKDEELVGLKVDWIITDYCMPGMTGYELLKKIKGCSALREIPVVIMSSENVVARIDRCLEEGAEDFIVKPVKLSDVERLKHYIMRDVKERNQERTHKRKLMETSEYSPLTTTIASSSSLSLSSSPTPTPSLSPSPLTSSPCSVSSPPLSPPSSPSQSTSGPPSTPSRSSSPSSPPPPIVSSPPSSPSSLESPIRRLKTTNLD